MKILLTSDIHGIVSSAEFIADIAQKEKVDIVVLLGDLLHGYSDSKDYDPRKCFLILDNISTRVIAVKGNCDDEDDRFHFSMPIAQSATLFNHHFIFTHGHIIEAFRPTFTKGDVICLGHSHVPLIKRTKDGLLYLNPGSISSPRSNSPCTYMMIEDGEVKLYSRDNNLLDSKMIE
ncbi:MAG: phosphodiesterase [Bacilli bacterium]|jgi:hypothetical protein